MKGRVSLRALLAGLCVALLTGFGCATPQHHPVPATPTRQAHLPGLEGARLVMNPFATELPEIDSFLGSSVRNRAGKSGPVSLLALSGGGAYGAYGAGVLCGWTRHGTRPEFDIVTGISTGSLMAPYAFLGTNHDEELKHDYTTTTDQDVFSKRSIFSILGGADSLADSAPL